MMPVITLLEVAARILSLAGIFQIILIANTQLGLIGSQLSTIAVLSLFLGQRLAQDYVGAKDLVGYFLVCLGSIYFMS